MLKYYALDDSERDSVHDAVLEGSFKHFGDYIGEESIANLFEHVPEEIHHLALQWTWNDTEVQESIYRFIDNNWNSLLNKI